MIDVVYAPHYGSIFERGQRRRRGGEAGSVAAPLGTGPFICANATTVLVVSDNGITRQAAVDFFMGRFLRLPVRCAAKQLRTVGWPGCWRGHPTLQIGVRAVE
jgi:hypothetical protein